MTQEISGKQVLNEFETLLRDAGVYLISVGKRVYVTIKTAIQKHKSESAEDPAESCHDIVGTDGKIICSAQSA